MSTDAELLLRYVEQRDERAFAELVERNLGLVYSAALRRTGGRTHLAEEISQKVFCDLARKSSSLLHHPALTGWLYRTTRYAAIDAARSELHRQKLTRDLTAMPDLSSSPEAHADWEKLRPVIDEAMDQLKPRDREIMLMRFFGGLTFAEVGARFNLTENAARMCADRALERLRVHLDKRGVTSTAGALSLLLATPAFAAAPSGLAAVVTASALAAPAVAGGAGVLSFFLMSKLTAPALSAILAAGLTYVTWNSIAPVVSAKELAALRLENVRLAQATAPGASAAVIATVADEFAARAVAVARVVGQKSSRQINASTGLRPVAGAAGSSAAPGAHRNRGRATPHDAFMSFAWGGDAGETEEVAKLVYFEPEVRAKAVAVLETMPESLRQRYPTPEELYAFFFVADALVAPPPGADVLEQFQVVELSPGRVALRRPGSSQNFQQYQKTQDGWKWVVPEIAVKNAPRVLDNETLTKLGTGGR